MAIVTMRELLEAGIHFGHQTRRWHPKMSRYIYGQRNGIYIIDLQKSMRQIYKAYGLIRDIAAKGGNVLFVGTKRQAQEAVQREAERCGMYYMTNRWLGGTLTNFQTVKQSIAELTRLQDLESSGDIEKYTKKERVVMRKRCEKLATSLTGIQKMPGLPQAIFVIDAKREAIAVREAERLGIPCIGIVDTNCDPDVVPLPIPGNDDAIRSVGLLCKVMADAVIEGKSVREKESQEEAEAAMIASEGSDMPEEEAAAEEAAPETADAPAEEAVEDVAEAGAEEAVEEAVEEEKAAE